MKSRFALLVFGGLFAWVVLMSTASGYNRNETGATGSQGCSCHGSSSSINPTVELDSMGVSVSSYVPGMSYTVTLSGTEVSGDGYFGFELSLVKASGAGTSSATQAGTWGTLPSGTKSSASKVMIEQSTRLSASNSMYSISIPWTAPAAGTGSVEIFGIINGVNGDGSTGGDGAQNATNNGFTITEATSCPSASITATDSLLTVTATGATSYQWYNNGTLISGATSATYVATASGSYTVAIVAGSCNVTSPAYVFTATSTGISDMDLSQNVKVYPTVAADMIHVEISENIDNTHYTIFSLNGDQYTTGPLSGGMNTIDIQNLAPAVYIIRVANDKNTASYKIVKQ